MSSVLNNNNVGVYTSSSILVWCFKYVNNNLFAFPVEYKSAFLIVPFHYYNRQFDCTFPRSFWVTSNNITILLFTIAVKVCTENMEHQEP